jgi:hypothetical protein
MIKALGIALGMTAALLAGPPPAQAADPLAPAFSITKAWAVAKGAGVEVSYRIVCPDAVEGRRHAMWTAVGGTVTDVLEFSCGPTPRTVTNLLSGVSLSGVQTIRTEVFNCLYFDFTSEPIPGCYLVTDVSEVRIKSGAFVPESSVDLYGDVELLSATLTPAGGVRLTHRLSCTRPMAAQLVTTLVQANRGVLTKASGTPPENSGYFECDPESTPIDVNYVVPAPSGQRFQAGELLVDAAWTWCDEGCDRGLDTRVVRLRTSVGRGPAPGM